MLKRAAPRPFRVSYDADKIVVRRPQATDVEAFLLWGEITKITFRTTGDGPWFPDFFVHFDTENEKNKLVVHDEMDGFYTLVERLSRLPDYDNAAAGKATRSANDATFLVWEAT